jgi:2-polyprenyl-6-methoxyphenol hydroxylase-like FAD-dependent oxidoreductase
MSTGKTVAIIGAGPVGLAAAAHVMERGMTPVVLESGPEAGHAIRQWRHVQLFSPWEYNVDRAAERLLAPTGWNSPDRRCTRREASCSSSISSRSRPAQRSRM